MSGTDLSQQLTVSCRVGRAGAGRRLLDLLAERFPYHDRGRWLEIVIKGQVLLNGAAVAPDQQVCAEDLLTYQVADHREPQLLDEIDVVVETPDLLVVSKPAGVPLHRTGRIIANTFVNQLRRHYGQDIHPLHRLDQETSGLLLCARSAEANRRYQRQRDEIITGKYYLAVVRGHFAEERVTVTQPLATRDDSPVRCRMWPTPAGKPCLTRFQRIAAAGGRSLLLAELESGRRHQIRAHLACLQHPLLGDKIYDHDGRFFLKRLDAPLEEDDFQLLGARHHTLHAWALRLKLPGQTERICFSQAFSADMEACLPEFSGWRERALSCLPPQVRTV